MTGAGSTFDQPLFARQFYDFNKANSKVSVNYASVGSGTGETDILAGSVNFGASDVPEPAGTTGEDEFRRAREGERRRWRGRGGSHGGRLRCIEVDRVAGLARRLVRLCQSDLELCGC